MTTQDLAHSTLTTAINVAGSTGSNPEHHYVWSPGRKRRDAVVDTSYNKEVEDALQAMSLSDLIGQVTQIPLAFLLLDSSSSGGGGDSKSRSIGMQINQTALEYYIGELGVGSVVLCSDGDDNNRGCGSTGMPQTVRELRALRMQIQDVAQRHHRPPVLLCSGGTLSVVLQNATMLPKPVNIAATFNVSAAYDAGRLISRDARAAGINWLLLNSGLSLQVALPARSSATFTTLGEDPFVIGEMGASLIRGIQEPDSVVHEKDDPSNSNSSVSIPSVAAACAPDFMAASSVGTRQVYDYNVEPVWRKVIASANVQGISVGSISTKVNGGTVPLLMDKATLNTLLRQRLGIDGVVLTDERALQDLHSVYKVVPTSNASAIVKAFQQTSIDMVTLTIDAAPRSHVDISSATKADEALRKDVSLDRIRDSARRVLQLKYNLQLPKEVVTMENNANIDEVGSDAGRVLDMVHQSIVLTQNKENLLPLSTTELNVLVTGPTSHSLLYQTGGWNRGDRPDETWLSYGSTIADAIAREATWNVTYTCGTDIDGQDCGSSGTTSSIDRAVQAAQASDVVVLCVGEESYNADAQTDIASLDLSTGQYQLVNAIATQAKNAKIVLIYIGGRPRLLKSMVDQVHAVLVAFLPGPSAGDAVANLLTGRVNPSGRLPLTYPLYDNGSPYFHAVSDPCPHGTISDDRGPCPAQWPFGYGLSYTSFAYHNLTLTPLSSTRSSSNNSSSGNDGNQKTLEVSVAVTNTGSLPGAEVVLVFMFDEYRPTIPEYKRLRAFDKVYLQPGQEQVVRLVIPLNDLRFVSPHDDHHSILDPTLTFWIGVGSSTDCRQNPIDEMCVYTSIRNLTKPGPTRDSDTDGDEDPDTYCAACEAACDVWIRRSGCAGEVGLSMNACLDMCTSVNTISPLAADLVKEGWGWNYVDCIESVVTGMKRQKELLQRKQHDDSSSSISNTQCWKMTTMCRDVFATENLDEFGVGPHAPMPNAHSQTPLSFALALLAGVVSTLLMLQAMHGQPQTRPLRRPWTRRTTAEALEYENDERDRDQTLYRLIEEEEEDDQDDGPGSDEQ